jgi:hypothetical protein
MGTIHIFTVKEDNIDVQYEVELSNRWHGMSITTTVRREGKIIFID